MVWKTEGSGSAIETGGSRLSRNEYKSLFEHYYSFIGLGVDDGVEAGRQWK